MIISVQPTDKIYGLLLCPQTIFSANDIRFTKEEIEYGRLYKPVRTLRLLLMRMRKQSLRLCRN